VVKALPNLITIANLALGFWSIKLIIEGLWYEVVVLIIAAMILDYLDGMVARKLNAVTELGKHLDSLSDLISFGVVPALMCWMILPFYSFLSGVLAVFYLWSGAYRLARFNSQNSRDSHFQGLPITAAGPLVAVLCLYCYYIPATVLGVVVFLLAASMISPIPFYSIKSKQGSFSQFTLIGLLGITITISFFHPWLLALVLGGYYFSGLILYVAEKKNFYEPGKNLKKTIRNKYFYLERRTIK